MRALRAENDQAARFCDQCGTVMELPSVHAELSRPLPASDTSPSGRRAFLRSLDEPSPDERDYIQSRLADAEREVAACEAAMDEAGADMRSARHRIDTGYMTERSDLDLVARHEYAGLLQVQDPLGGDRAGVPACPCPDCPADRRVRGGQQTTWAAPPRVVTVVASVEVPGVVEPIESATFDWHGQPLFLGGNVHAQLGTIIRAGHPFLKLHPGLFEPLTVDAEFDHLKDG